MGGTEAQCLGERTDVSLDSFARSLQLGDKLLLCTDGVWKFVPDPVIEGVLSIPVSDPSQTSNALIQTALEGEGKDHIGVVIVQFHPAMANVEMKEQDTTAGRGAHPRTGC
jgi:protein phosphatase